MKADEPSALQRLVDKDAIVDLVHRYSFCVDHRLYDEVVTLFTDDCVVDYGPDFPTVRGRTALRTMFGDPAGGYRATSHHNANVLVDFVDADRAEVRTSMYAWHRIDDTRTPQVWGYYHDVVVRSADGWLIAARQLRALDVEQWGARMHPSVESGTEAE